MASMSVADEVLRSNEAYAATFDAGALPLRPGRKLAVLACMDSRLDPIRALGLTVGDAHVIRNAGGIATDDAIRSLAISQRLLGTEEIVVVHHTNCGMHTLDDEAFRAELEQETGSAAPWATEPSGGVEADVRASLGRLRESPFLLHRDRIRGFVFEVETGRLREVA
jgi:carbonic anhydrase